MSRVKLNDTIDELHGEFVKNSGVIMRQKKYRAPSGKVIALGAQEAYKIVNPRDYAKNPPKGAELENINLFKDSKARTTEILKSARFSDEELADMKIAQRTHILALRAQLEDYTKRFYAQFNRPDNEAPFEKTLRPNSSKFHRKQYRKLDTFIQAIEREKLKNQLAQ
ncbi:MAG: hypothetical protein IJT12_08115 [Paludibacteraceae bacterium]|nr:hypothetical protein [Paludibacteraceae bacterium]